MLPVDINPDTLSAEAIALLGAEIDHLALQVMLRGSQACTGEGLAAILAAANRFSFSELVQLTQQTIELQSKAALTDDEARACVSRMQLMIAPAPEAAQLQQLPQPLSSTPVSPSSRTIPTSSPTS
jgi:hypothetical protein